jgi:hypothetical protein
MEGAWPPHQRIREGRGRFTASEDARLREVVMQYGPDGWQTVAEHMPDRIARQCRDRWSQYLDPVPKSRPLSKEIEDIIKSGFKEKKTPQAISREILNKKGNFISPTIISWYRHHVERPVIRRERGRVSPAAVRPPPQAQPPVLASQPGDQSFTDYQHDYDSNSILPEIDILSDSPYPQWDQLDEQDKYGLENWFE